MANVSVRLPRVLARLTSCDPTVEASGETLGDALRDLARRRPALALHLFDDTGSVRRHVLCFLNDEGARGQAALDRPLRNGDTVTVVNSLAGG